MKPPENFEHFDCGFRYPRPGTFTLSTSIGYSAYRDLGDGQINRFTSNLVTYDIGCIDLDDPPRKMEKAELISSLNAMTKAYLDDSFEFISRPATISGGREIYEFESRSFPQRRIKYLLEGNRVLIFLAGAYDVSAVGEAVLVFNSVKYFSVKEAVEKRMAAATQRSLPQSPALKLAQTDAVQNNLKGVVKSVRREAEDVPVLVGRGDRRILGDESYDRNGNLLRDFWFQDSGYPTSVTIYGFVDGARVSDSEEIDYDTTMTITGIGSGDEDVNSQEPDPRFEDRYSYGFDKSKRLIERKEYDNRGKLSGTYTFTYSVSGRDEKWFAADGKLNSTKRWQLDKKGNELTYKFWWYEDTDNETESYKYEKFDRFGNWTQRQVVKTITDRGLVRTRTSTEFRTITYY